MSALYPSFLEELLKNGLALATLDVRAVAIDSADETYNAADVFLSDVTSAGLVGPAVSLTSKTFTGGVFDASDVTFPAVTGDSIEAILLYVHTGTPTTSRLIGYFDGVALTPNGSDVLCSWPNGSSKIFQL